MATLTIHATGITITIPHVGILRERKNKFTAGVMTKQGIVRATASTQAAAVAALAEQVGCPEIVRLPRTENYT